MILILRPLRALSQTKTLRFPCGFLRHKSITAAIERGKQRSSGNFSDQDKSQSWNRLNRNFRSLDRRQGRSDRFGDIRQPGHASSDSVRDKSSHRRTDFGLSASSRTTGRAPRRRSLRENNEFSEYGHRSQSLSCSNAPDVGRRSLQADFKTTRDRKSVHEGSSEQAMSLRVQENERSRRTTNSSFEDSNKAEFSSRRPTERSCRSTSTRTPRDRAEHISKAGAESLPFTTAASEFLYGTSSVLAAIRAGRRKFYKLYLYERGSTKDRITPYLRDKRLFSLLQEVGDEYVRAMDRAANGRPHNGVILEASPLPVPPVTTLGSTSITASTFNVKLDYQSAEELAVNSQEEEYSYRSKNWRHPLVLYVDGVLDEGNLGAIARSAYFLGVDAIITPSRETAPWSHIAVKASAGAAEALPVFNVRSPTEFLGQSARQGWRIYASDSISPTSRTALVTHPQGHVTGDVVYAYTKSSKAVEADHCPVADAPTILMMGAEGGGLRKTLVNLAHYKVGIRQGRDTDDIGVDSLNVSAAASILCYEMLKRPQKPQSSSEPSDTLF